MPIQKLAKGYKCPACELKNLFSSWVYTHWDIAIVHTCECGRRSMIKQGKCITTEEDKGSGEFT